MQKRIGEEKGQTEGLNENEGIKLREIKKEGNEVTVEVVIGRSRQIGFEAYGFSRGAPRDARGPLE